MMKKSRAARLLLLVLILVLVGAIAVGLLSFREEIQVFYLNILVLNPHRSVNALYELSNIHRYRGDHKKAERDLKKALDIEPGNVWFWTDLGKLYRSIGKYDQAIIAFEKAAEIDPKFDLIYSYGLGYLYRDLQEFGKAETAFKKALELNPRNDFNFMGLGDYYRVTKENKLAEYMYKRALALNPKSEALAGFGLLLLAEGRFTEAEARLKQYLETDRKNKEEIYYYLGNVYLAQGDYGAAKDAFTKSVRINPTRGGYFGLGELYVRLNKYNKAERMFKKEISIGLSKQRREAAIKKLKWLKSDAVF